jgi:hypothetical protein
VAVAALAVLAALAALLEGSPVRVSAVPVVLAARPAARAVPEAVLCPGPLEAASPGPARARARCPGPLPVVPDRSAQLAAVLEAVGS